jgi:hypothetical protein
MCGRTDDITQKKWLNSMALFSRAWREVCADELVPGRLILSWQPRDDPAAERQTLRADRCAELKIPWMDRGTKDGYLDLAAEQRELASLLWFCQRRLTIPGGCRVRGAAYSLRRSLCQRIWRHVWA